jgi:hypothetical protein
MNHLRNNLFRNISHQQVIDAALIIAIIVMTFAYKMLHTPPPVH